MAVGHQITAGSALSAPGSAINLVPFVVACSSRLSGQRWQSSLSTLSAANSRSMIMVLGCLGYHSTGYYCRLDTQKHSGEITFLGFGARMASSAFMSYCHFG